MKAGQSRWFKVYRPNPDASIRLFCFPYAGSGASGFRKWPERLPANIELRAVQLPGREDRFVEKPIDRVETIVQSVGEAIPDLLDRPFAFFGHSMGSLIAFELARHLRRVGSPQPVALMVSGQRPPQAKDPPPRRFDLPQKEFLEMLRNIDGTPPGIIDNPEMMEMLTPLLRADFAVCETYAYSSEPPLTCPIAAFGGELDGEVSPEILGQWREQTSGDFRLRMFPGGHFYLQASEANFLDALSNELRAVSF